MALTSLSPCLPPYVRLRVSVCACPSVCARQRLEDDYQGKGDRLLHAAAVDAAAPHHAAAPALAASGPPSVGVPDGGSAAHAPGARRALVVH